MGDPESTSLFTKNDVSIIFPHETSLSAEPLAKSKPAPGRVSTESISWFLKGRSLSLVCLRLHFSLHPRRNPRTAFRKSQFLVCISSTWICRSTSIVSCSSSTLVKPPKPSTRRTPSMPRLVSLFCKSLPSNT